MATATKVLNQRDNWPLIDNLQFPDRWLLQVGHIAKLIFRIVLLYACVFVAIPYEPVFMHLGLAYKYHETASISFLQIIPLSNADRFPGVPSADLMPIEV